MTVADIERIGAPQITMADARKAFLEYRRAVVIEGDPQRKAEYEGLVRGYKAIAAGKQVIDLAATMKTAGINPLGHKHGQFYPRLAICRADAKRCAVEMKTDGSAVFRDAVSGWRATKRRVTLPVATFPPFATRWNVERFQRDRIGPAGGVAVSGWSTSATALVPIVPPALHPKAALGNYHIVWDAVWTPAAPVDPLLVKHLAGHLYVIVAHWGLTPLEQAVLRGRL